MFKKEETKIVSNYTKLTEEMRIANIRNQMNGVFNKKEIKKDIIIPENKDIYKDRINALKNIKKD